MAQAVLTFTDLEDGSINVDIHAGEDPESQAAKACAHALLLFCRQNGAEGQLRALVEEPPNPEVETTG